MEKKTAYFGLKEFIKDMDLDDSDMLVGCDISDFPQLINSPNATIRIGNGEGEGELKIKKALNVAIDSMINNIRTSTGTSVYLKLTGDVSASDIQEMIDRTSMMVGNDISLFFAAKYDDSIEDYCNITIIYIED